MHPITLVTLLVIRFLGLPIGSIGQSQGAVPVARLQLPPNATGPDSTAFNQAGRGPFTGISDGRILEYVNSSVGFVEFSVTLNTRTLCDFTDNPPLVSACGRPLGLTFNRRTGELFVAYSPRGLVVVSPDGSNATLLASSAGGVQFRFLNGVDIDQNSGVVYFTDTSAIFTLSQVFSVILTRDRTGRLLSYDPRTKEVRVLQRGLAGPDGVAVSRDGSFLLFSEIVTSTIQRFWIRGPRANTTELVARVEGLPDGIRRNARGEFWVATTVDALSLAPRPVGLRFSEQGVLLQNVTFNITTPGLILSQVEEFNGQLYLGLTTQRFIGRANLIPPA